MNREILFRGKRLDNWEWVYGAFVPDALEMLNGLDGMDGFIRRYNPESHKTDVFEIERDTVGQWTGLTDRAGKRIFEGDVVELNATLYLVDWLSSTGMFVLRYVRNRESITDFSIIGPERCKVRSNIHDHPELLEGDTK